MGVVVRGNIKQNFYYSARKCKTMRMPVNTRVIVESWYGSEDRATYSRRAYFRDPVNAYKHYKHLQKLIDLGKDWHIAVMVEDVTEGDKITLFEVRS